MFNAVDRTTDQFIQNARVRFYIRAMHESASSLRYKGPIFRVFCEEGGSNSPKAPLNEYFILK